MGTNFREIFKKVVDSEWAIAYRKKRNGEILHAERQCFSLLRNTLRYWCADPFPVEAGGRVYIFFEAFDRIKRKGAIGYREINGSKIGRINIAIEEAFHLSYPYLYQEDGRWYLIPESKDAGKIIRYRSIEFPGVWEYEKVIADGIAAVDTTIISCSNGSVDAFTYLFERFNKGTLQRMQLNDTIQNILYEAEDLDGRKRPAGKICLIDSIYYRPSQLCTKTYGEAIIFNRIERMTDEIYEEKEYKVLTAENISLGITAKISGVHTYNYSENWEVIDVKYSGLSLIRFIGLVPRLYHFIKRR